MHKSLCTSAGEFLEVATATTDTGQVENCEISVNFGIRRGALRVVPLFYGIWPWRSNITLHADHWQVVVPRPAFVPWLLLDFCIMLWPFAS